MDASAWVAMGAAVIALGSMGVGISQAIAAHRSAGEAADQVAEARRQADAAEESVLLARRQVQLLEADRRPKVGWSLNWQGVSHLVLSNVGDADAFDVRVDFDPWIEPGTGRALTFPAKTGMILTLRDDELSGERLLVHWSDQPEAGSDADSRHLTPLAIPPDRPPKSTMQVW